MKRFLPLFAALSLIYAPALGQESNGAPDFQETKTHAEQGDADAQFNIGVMYGLGQGVPQNYAVAYMWIKLAGHRGKT